MPFEDYLPNVFGGTNPQIAGLLGEEQAGQLSKQANVSGLLGAAMALAQGMSPAGYRRSAAQNVLTALGAGMQGAQGTYQNAVQQAMAGQRMAKDSAETQLAQMRGLTELQKQQLEAYKQQRLMTLREKLANGQQLTDADLMEINGDKFVESRLNPKAPQTVQFPDGSLRQWNPSTNQYTTVGEKPAPNVQVLDGIAAKQAGLDPNAGQWVIKDGVPSIVNGTENPSSFREYQLSGSKLPFDAWLIRNKQATAPKVEVNTSDPTAVTKAAMDVSKDFNALTKEDREIRTRYDQLHSAYKNPALGGSGDAAMIYHVAKILDPQGAVREGDVSMIAGSPAFPDQLRKLAERFVSNKRLTPQERDQLMSLGYEIVSKKAKGAEFATNQYRGYANNFGVRNPEQQIRNPYEGFEKPQYRVIRFNGSEVRAQLSPKDGRYYVQSGGKFYPVED